MTGFKIFFISIKFKVSNFKIVILENGESYKKRFEKKNVLKDIFF